MNADLEDLVATGAVGVGRGTRLAAGHSPDAHYLDCDRCGAGWVGREGEICMWCVDRHASMRRGQADLVLAPELPDPGDRRRGRALKAWRDRLVVAIEAGTISKDEALKAIEREMKRR